MIQSTPRGAVFFVDQVLQVEIFLSPGYILEDEEDGTVYSDGGGGLRPICPQEGMARQGLTRSS